MVAPRAGESLSAAERRLLADLARQAGPAVAALGLTDELERSRRRLVAAREEERRRLRNDLHDGLGPTLATLALQVDLARRGLPDGDAGAGSDAHLADLRAGLDEALVDVRRLVYGLRPPALDDLGLVAALEEQAARLARLGGMEVRVHAPVRVVPLPAAVEVAAFRIAQEALTNALRHSGARRCDVRLAVADRLVLEVADDGRGLAPGTSAGVGLRSMRERAAEVGGALTLETGPGGGTLVRALLPLVAPEADDGSRAVAEALELQPDVVVMDLRMPVLSGIEAARALATAAPATRVVVLSMYEDDESVFAALRAGAHGYLLKGARPEEVLGAVRAVGAGGAVFGPALARRLLEWFGAAADSRAAGPFPGLTAREREVLDRVAAGRPNGEIARALGLAPKTVRNHVSNILTKLQVADRAQAIVKARDAGLGGARPPGM